MYLNEDILFDQLSNSLNLDRHGEGKDELYLGRPLFYDPKERLQEQRVYIAYSDDLSALPPRGSHILMICVGDHPPQTWFFRKISLFVVKDSQDLFRVFNLVQAVFDYFDAWESRMDQILEEDSDLGRMIDASAEIFTNQITITDHNAKVRAANCALPEYDQWVSGQLVPSDFLSLDNFRQCSTQTKPFLHRYPIRPGGGDLSVYSVNLTVHDQYAGCAAITDYIQAFKCGDFILFRKFVEFANKAVEKLSELQNSHAISMHSVIKDLLDGLSVDDFRLNRVIDQIKSNDSANICWTCLTLRPEGNLQSVPIEYIRTSLEDLVHACFAIIYDSEIVFILRTAPKGEEIEEILVSINSFIRDFRYKAGVSTHFTDIRKLRLYYNQACSVLELGKIQDPNALVYKFEDWVFPYMLSRCSGEFWVEDLLSPGLKELINHDRTGAVSYWRTLQAFLDHKMNIADTARAMFLHRNTLIKRLSSIYAILGTRLEDPAERLYVWLCMYVMANVGLPDLPEDI